MPGELSAAREVAAGLILGTELLAIVVVAVIGARRVAPDDRLLATVIGVLLAIAQPVGISLVTGMVGLFSLAAVVAGHVALAVAALVLDRRATTRAPAAAESPGRPPSAWVLAALAAVTAYLVLAIGLSLGVPSRDNDTHEYHVTNAAHWLQDGTIWSLPFQSAGGVTATHPGDGELLAAWLALPTGGDELSYLMPLAFAALAIAAGSLLARELNGGGGSGASAAAGALAVVAVLAAPLSVTSQVDSLSTDVLVAACILATLALLVTARRRPSAALVLAAGVTLGLGVGGKYTALAPGLAAALAAVVLLPRRRLWWWLVPGVALFALPWFVRNLVQAGNPLYPQALGPFSGADFPLDVLSTSIVRHALDGDGDVLHRWYDLVARLVGPAALVAAAGTGLALRRARERVGRLTTAAVVVTAFAFYLAIPFSGGGPTGLDFLVASSLRYALTVVLIGAVLLAAVAPVSAAGWVLTVVLAWDAWRMHFEVPDSRPDMPWSAGRIGAAVAAAIVVVVVARRPDRWRGWLRAIDHRRAVTGALAALLVAGATAAVVHHLDRGRTPTAIEARLLAFGPREPVVVLGVGDVRSLLGPRLERPLVGVSRDGKVTGPPFVDRNQVRRDALGDTSAPATPPALAAGLDAALKRARADLLVVGPAGLTAYPDGWKPDTTWCPVANVDSIGIFARTGSTPARACGSGS